MSDPITLPQALAWEKAVRDTRAKRVEMGDDFSITASNAAMLPGILACVETWELENLDPNKFPASPRRQSIELLTWLITEISSVYIGEEEKTDPNE